MNLYIAEKPSVANDIAKALVGNFQKKDGYLESADNVVTWYMVLRASPEID